MWPDPLELELHENILLWIVLKALHFCFLERIKSAKLQTNLCGGPHGVGEAGFCLDFFCSYGVVCFFGCQLSFVLAAPRKRMDLSQSHLQKDSL